MRLFMNIIFVSSVCDRDEYEFLFNNRKKKMIDPTQKFLDQIISGVAKSADDVFSVSIRPVSFSSMKKFLFKKETKKIGNITYIYPSFINGIFSRFFTQFLSIYREISHVLKNTETRSDETVIICDALCLQASMAARLAAKKRKVKSVVVVTDIPILATKMKSSKKSLRQVFQSFYEKITMKEIKKYDGYINLVKEMDEWVNPLQKPSIVIEGTVEVNSEKSDRADSRKKIVLYAGGINKSYGLEMLVKGFIQSGYSNAELHIYGTGSYVDELIEISKHNPEVKYMGVVLNNMLTEIESQATLLVNPRFSDEEYTFYSFPSKTLEYMSSGTPVCSTRLRGIPKEYENYIYWIEDESVLGIANTLSFVLNKKQEELESFGRNAKLFVDKNKNKYIQGEKIVDFCNQLLSIK